MNPVLEEIYSTIIPSAPFLIAAYALIWLVLLVFVFVSLRGMKRTEAQIAVLEEAVAELKAK
jgi:CcmD family protein